MITPVVFLISIPVAFLFGSQAAKLTWLTLVVLSPLLSQLADRRSEASREADS